MKTLLTSLIVLATATLMTVSSFAQTSETSPSATASPAITLSPSGVTSPGMHGQDNVKKKFAGSWGETMSSGLMSDEGDYDPATKTNTYASEYEAIHGMKTKIRETVKIADKDHHTFEWYENRGGQEVKTMGINYTRKK